MGLLWRLFAPKPVKKARRTVRKAAHPVRTATRAVTPKPVKQLQRAAHPVSLAVLKIEDAAVNALRGRPRHQQSRHTAQASTVFRDALVGHVRVTLGGHDGWRERPRRQCRRGLVVPGLAWR